MSLFRQTYTNMITQARVILCLGIVWGLLSYTYAQPVFFFQSLQELYETIPTECRQQMNTTSGSVFSCSSIVQNESIQPKECT